MDEQRDDVIRPLLFTGLEFSCIIGLGLRSIERNKIGLL